MNFAGAYEHEPVVPPEPPHLGSAVLALREGMANSVVDNAIALIEGRHPTSRLNPGC